MSAKFSTTDLLHSIRQIPKSLITYTEKYVLTILLSCMNADNKTWYSMEAICEFACLGRTTVKSVIKRLAQKRFISIIRPDVYTHKMTNNYSLNLDFILSFHLKSGSQYDPNINVGVTIRPQSGSEYDPVRGRQVTTKIDIKKERKRGGEKAPLPDDFKPDKQSCELGESLGLEPKIIEEFKDYCRAKGISSQDWQATFRKFLRDEDAYRMRKKQNGKPVQEEIHSTVRDFEPVEVKGTYTPEVAARALGDILGKLGMPKGAKPNGHGRSMEKGKIPKD